MRHGTVTLITVAVLAAGLTAAILLRSGDCAQQLSIDGDGFTVLSSEDGIQVIVSSPEDFHMGALTWVLSIGDMRFDRSGYPHVNLRTLAFPIPDEALALIADRDPVTVSYGIPVGSGSGGFATGGEGPPPRAAAQARIAEVC